MIINYDGTNTRYTVPNKISEEDINIMAECFDAIKTNKDSKEIVNKACQTIKSYLSSILHINTTITVIAETGDSFFYGFNVFPSISSLKTIIKCISEKNFNEIRGIWSNISDWHIDIDGKMLYDYKSKLTTREMVALLFHRLDMVCYNASLPMHLAYAVYEHMTKANFVISYLAHSEKCSNLYLIPLLHGISVPNFKFMDCDSINTGIIGYSPQLNELYRKAIKKLVFAYGNGFGVDTSVRDICHIMRSTLNWMYEGIVNLQYSSMGLKKRLRTHLHACRSPYVREVFKMLISIFTNIQGKVAVKEGYTSNPMIEKMNEQIEIDYWKNYFHTKENAIANILYPTGANNYMKKISRSDIDMIRVEAENIESVDDKVYLLEKVYKLMEDIDLSLELLNNKDSAKRVKQTKSELLHLREELEHARKFIIDHRIGADQYGLFIKYPNGYAG